MFCAEDQTQSFAQALENVFSITKLMSSSVIFNIFTQVFLNLIFTQIYVGIKYPWSWNYRLWAI